jgi:sigma-E factor negative regulatory protein RseA
MKSDVSALLDGELEAHEAKAAFAALHDEGELRRAWDEYQTIGAALRHEDRLGACLTARVMAGLAHDVTVLTPRSPRATAWHRPLMALAASVAGVAVVGWVAFSGQLAPTQVGSVQLASAVPSRPAAGATVAAGAPATPARPAVRREMQDYVAAHQAQVAVGQVMGGTQHIRTVSAGMGDERR